MCFCLWQNIIVGGTCSGAIHRAHLQKRRITNTPHKDRILASRGRHKRASWRHGRVLWLHTARITLMAWRSRRRAEFTAVVKWRGHVQLIGGNKSHPGSTSTLHGSFPYSILDSQKHTRAIPTIHTFGHRVRCIFFPKGEIIATFFLLRQRWRCRSKKAALSASHLLCWDIRGVCIQSWSWTIWNSHFHHRRVVNILELPLWFSNWIRPLDGLNGSIPQPPDPLPLNRMDRGVRSLQVTTDKVHTWWAVSAPPAEPCPMSLEAMPT